MSTLERTTRHSAGRNQ